MDNLEFPNSGKKKENCPKLEILSNFVRKALNNKFQEEI